MSETDRIWHAIWRLREAVLFVAALVFMALTLIGDRPLVIISMVGCVVCAIVALMCGAAAHRMESDE